MINTSIMFTENMTSKERINTAMGLKTPDRVPLMCQFSIGFMTEQLKPADPAGFWYDKETFGDGLIKLCEDFKFDGILVSLHGHSDKWKEGIISSEVVKEGEIKLTYPDKTEVHSWQELPVVVFKNDIFREIEGIDIDKDVPEHINYIPVSHNLYFDLDKDHLYDIFDYIYDKVGDSVSIHGEVTSPFDYFMDLLGYENGLMGLMIDPEKSLQIIDKFTNGVIEIAKGMCDKPIDAIKISSPFAGRGFISCEFYAKFVQPFEKRLIAAIKDKGKCCYIHTCGFIGDRLELMRDSGVSGLECLDPHPVGDVDLKDAFDRVGKDIFVKGNIDSVHTLLMGDDNKVLEDVTKIIETGKKYGSGFILSTACSIAPLVPKERIFILSGLIEKYGEY